MWMSLEWMDIVGTRYGLARALSSLGYRCIRSSSSYSILHGTHWVGLAGIYLRRAAFPNSGPQSRWRSIVRFTDMLTKSATWLHLLVAWDCGSWTCAELSGHWRLFVLVSFFPATCARLSRSLRFLVHVHPIFVSYRWLMITHVM